MGCNDLQLCQISILFKDHRFSILEGDVFVMLKIGSNDCCR